MAEGVILAAGQSRRTAPDCKLLLRAGGMTLLGHAVAGMAAHCARVFVVTGAHAGAVGEALSGMANVVPVHNPGYRTGMFGSVLAGLRETAADEVFVLPGDCPFVPDDVYAALLKEPGGVVVPAWCGREGHPVLLRRPAISALLCGGGHRSLREFIAAYGARYALVGSPAILDDIDTPEAYGLAAAREEGAGWAG
ncbi:MAG TPA: nucleotidyltransferase family protein [Candidatus Limnocylindria bacterium]|nr:nucleotidyltransferase family protein [Candidatus Limnocylindria bacterium]